VAKIMARILSKYAVSSCLQVIHSADARSFDEGQPLGLWRGTMTAVSLRHT
jgi:hypothetical protein